MTGSRHTWVIQNRPIRIESQDWHQTSTGTFHWANHRVCNVKIKMIAVPVISCSSQNQSITKYIQFEYPYYASIHIIQEPWPITDWEDHVWKKKCLSLTTTTNGTTTAFVLLTSMRSQVQLTDISTLTHSLHRDSWSQPQPQVRHHEGTPLEYGIPPNMSMTLSIDSLHSDGSRSQPILTHWF